MEEKKQQRVDYLTAELSKLNEGKSKFMFFILDTKAVPSGTLQYIYTIAKSLADAGKDVYMLHEEKEADFVGVGSWMGKEYSELKHVDINSGEFKVSAADFLFIPDIFINVMEATANMPCKRFVIVQNPDFITEFMPFGKQLGDYRLMDVITNTDRNASIIKDWFPYVQVHVLKPQIKPIFFDCEEPKKMIVNIVSTDSDASKIAKPFYWKYPQFRFVSFRCIGGIEQQDFANALREAAITVWCDGKTKFGYTGIEVLASGGILIAKAPEENIDWLEESKWSAGIWFNSFEEAHKLIAGYVRAWMRDEIDYEQLKKGKEEILNKYYGGDRDFTKESVALVEKLVEKRKFDLNNTIANIK